MCYGFKTFTCRFWFPCCCDPEDRPMESIVAYRSPYSEKLLGPKNTRRKQWIRPRADAPIYMCFFGIYVALIVFYIMWMDAYFDNNAAQNVRNSTGAGMASFKAAVPLECTEMPDVFMAYFISCGCHIFFTLAQFGCMTPRSCWYWVNRILRLFSMISTIVVCIWGIYDVLEEAGLQCMTYIRTVGSDKFWVATEQFELVATIFIITMCLANILVADEVIAIIDWFQAEPDPEMYLTEDEKKEQLLQEKRDDIERRKSALKVKHEEREFRKRKRAESRERKRREVAERKLEERVKAEIAPRISDPNVFHASRSRTLEPESYGEVQGYGATGVSNGLAAGPPV